MTDPHTPEPAPRSDQRAEHLGYLITTLRPDLALPDDAESRWLLLRSLMNIRPPGQIIPEWLSVQDDVLRREIEAKGITRVEDLEPIDCGIYLWEGDITTLQVDGIVNAANSAMLGCFHPLHRCIDNAIHTYAGIQLREECASLMRDQGHPEPTGSAKLTGGYNLPAKHIIHTIGPIVADRPSHDDREQLASCYRSCLTLAMDAGMKSLAFCGISTGEYRFPKVEAAKIATRSVAAFRRDNPAAPKVVFNVFTPEEFRIYEEILTRA